MTRQFWALAAAASVALAAGCITAPTDELSGVPARISTSASLIQINEGDSVLVSASLLDLQGVPLAVVPTPTSSDAGVITVSDASQPPLSQTRFYVKGVAPGVATVDLSADTVDASVTVVVLPLAFGGAVTVSSAAGGIDTIRVAATSVITFDTTTTPRMRIAIGDWSAAGEQTHLVSLSATEATVLSVGRIAISDTVLYAHGLTFLAGTEYETSIDSLPVATRISTTADPREPGNDGAAPDVITLGGSIEASVAAVDVDDWYQFTLAAPTAVSVTLQFDGNGSGGAWENPDMDVYITPAVNSGFCTLDGCAGGTSANPETATTGVLPAGTYYINVNLFGAFSSGGPFWYRLSLN